MKCSYCGAENSDNAIFCNLCLKEFQVAQTSVLTETKPITPQTVPSVGKTSVNAVNISLIVKIALASLALVLLVVLVIKGGGVARDMVKDAMGISTSRGGGIKIKRVIGGKMVETSIGKLPKDFPSDIPVYKGARVKIGQSAIEQSGTVTYMVIWTSDSPKKNIFDFYKSALPQNQYQITTPSVQGIEESGLLQFSKGAAQGKLIVANKSSETNIMVNLTINN